MLNYESPLLPDHMKDGMKLYIEKGILPGSFMTAVLTNDLALACSKADSINRIKLFDIVSWLFAEVPHNCWKSVDAVQEWTESGGLSGRASTQARKSGQDITV